MLVVRVELWSAITHQKTTIALASICNVGGSHTKGDYEIKTFKGRDEATLMKALVNDTVSHRGDVKGHPRLAEHVWNLVGKALAAAGYKTA